VLTRSVVAIPDVLEEPEYTIQDAAIAGGFRSVLAVPLMRDNKPIGAIAVGRPEPGPFPGTQIALLQTFADQAVIAIENVRLFTELEARTLQLTQSVGELKALGEVGQAVSSTLDLETVLSTIVSRATQLAGMDGGRSGSTTKRARSFTCTRRTGCPGNWLRCSGLRPSERERGAGSARDHRRAGRDSRCRGLNAVTRTGSGRS
jgi:GAF domain-containing protein